MHDLTGFQRDLLVVLAGMNEPYGLAIKEELDRYYPENINHGRLYPNLDILVDKGLIEKGNIDERTNFYAITEEGKKAIIDRREWEPDIEG